mmetsp:Transcript_19099/g.44764  ORF Transcript_19099/g.44764 Transcript_19099/m.44764 type:complete len:215 (-) Transcript_19099:1635-2279(-)
MAVVFLGWVWNLQHVKRVHVRLEDAPLVGCHNQPALFDPQKRKVAGGSSECGVRRSAGVCLPKRRGGLLLVGAVEGVQQTLSGQGTTGYRVPVLDLRVGALRPYNAWHCCPVDCHNTALLWPTHGRQLHCFGVVDGDVACQSASSNPCTTSAVRYTADVRRLPSRGLGRKKLCDDLHLQREQPSAVLRGSDCNLRPIHLHGQACGVGSQLVRQH